MAYAPDQMNAVVQGLVSLMRYAETGPALEALAQLPVTYAERVSEVDETAKALRMGRGQIVYWFKHLTSVGCGRFIVGRKGGRSRFEWWFDPVSVHEAASQQRQDLDPLLAPDHGAATPDFSVFDEEGDGATDEAAPSISNSDVDYTLMLRPGLPVRFTLPESLTVAEAERLCAFIRTLPFG